MTAAPLVADLPHARGPLSAALLAALVRPPRPLPTRLRRLAATGTADPLADEDLQLSLHLCYELHYRGLAGVDERWEWQPSLLGVRAVLEARLERALRELAAPLLPAGDVPPADVPRRAGRAGRRRRRPLAGRAHAPARDGRAVARVAGAPVDLPAQGGRPAHLGDPAADRAGQGGAGGDPGRRVRRRPAGADARGAVRRRDARSSAWTTRTAPTSTGAGGRRSRPASTRCRCSACTGAGAARPLGHLAALEMTSSVPNAPLRRRPAPARLRAGGDPLLRRARRGGRGARAGGRARPVRRAGRRRAGAGRAGAHRGRLLPGPGRADRPATCWSAGSRG